MAGLRLEQEAMELGDELTQLLEERGGERIFKGTGDGQTAAFCSIMVEHWFPSALSSADATWQPSLCLGHAEAKVLNGLSRLIV